MEITFENLKAVLADALQEDPSQITEDKEQKDFANWDSLAHLIVISEIEDQFDVQLPASSIESLTSVKALWEVLQKCVKTPC